jgi:hypothetical protein
MKPFAIYFPQFYSTPTNDEAWGHGFTDWVLVANANLRDSWVRRAPRRGFYNGASRDVHRAQIDEMRSFGLGGFAVYHYWFYSHQELSAFESTLLAERPRMPWFIIWATEGWSKRWLGDPTALVRLSDDPTADEIDEHAGYLARCFANPDYFRIDGKPLFIVYNLGHFIRPDLTIARYRQALLSRGFDIVVGQFIKNPSDVQYSNLVDVNYLFEPRLFFGMKRAARGARAKRAHDVIRRVLGESLASRLMLLLDRIQQRGTSYHAKQFLSYLDSREREAIIRSIDGPVQEALSPGWNNTPRYSERFTALDSIDAAAFGRLVHEAGERCTSLPPLINAWNEWSEGAAIEPCAYFGSRYLDAMNLQDDPAVLEPRAMKECS